jgi:hypothetical protein
LFSPLSEQHKKKKSFVVVISDIDYNAIPDTLAVVPSLLEAKTLLLMEEIERDLVLRLIFIKKKSSNGFYSNKRNKFC